MVQDLPEHPVGSQPCITPAPGLSAESFLWVTRGGGLPPAGHTQRCFHLLHPLTLHPIYRYSHTRTPLSYLQTSHTPPPQPLTLVACHTTGGTLAWLESSADCIIILGMCGSFTAPVTFVSCYTPSPCTLFPLATSQGHSPSPPP
jgi:hypothetical protein